MLLSAITDNLWINVKIYIYYPKGMSDEWLFELLLIFIFISNTQHKKYKLSLTHRIKIKIISNTNQ